MKAKILFADDDQNLLHSYKRYFRKEYNIIACEDGKTALQKLAVDHQIAVIIADKKMPEMDGLTLLSEARKISPSTVRIMLTGEADLEAAVRGVNECDLFRFLIKPFPTEKLHDIIQEALEQYRLNRAVLGEQLEEEEGKDFVSVCSYCHQIRIPKTDPYDTKSWERFEVYFNKKYGLRFSHGICPDCVPEFLKTYNPEKHKNSEENDE